MLIPHCFGYNQFYTDVHCCFHHSFLKSTQIKLFVDPSYNIFCPHLVSTNPSLERARNTGKPNRSQKVAPAVTRTVRVTHKCYVRKESEKNKKRQNKNIALQMRTESSARSFFRPESVHDSISFLCERGTTLKTYPVALATFYKMNKTFVRDVNSDL